MRLKIVLICLGFLVFTSSIVNAAVIITEILADPPLGMMGDANNDGLRSGSDDEFIEIYNNGDFSVDLSGWIFSDALDRRHEFSDGTIVDPFQSFVVFGGGDVDLIDVYWQTASTGLLSLNNTGDILYLKDEQGAVVDSVEYGSEANNDQSIVRYPLESDNFVLHTEVGSNQGLSFSPGYIPSAIIPEPCSFLSFFIGLVGFVLNHRKK